jgi:PHS family inorganic phosphate transporter-like MFS transporter
MRVGRSLDTTIISATWSPMRFSLTRAPSANVDLAWRLMLGLGALPAIAVIYLRRRIPESPRYLSRVKGETETAARDVKSYSGAVITALPAREPRVKASLRNYLLTLRGTAGTWFVFDYAYYGNSISTPLIMKMVAPNASLITSVAWTLVVFAVAAVPGYFLAISNRDRIGHRKLQLIGFAVMGLAFLTIGVVPAVTAAVLPFLIVYGISYFFAEFGPNTTTFVLSRELYPVNLRTTGHGLSAGIAKVGAFIGVFLFPVMAASLGLAGTLTVTFGFAMVGFLLTLLLPEPAGRTLEDISGEDRFQVHTSGTTPAG